jgi:large subunit ribosomal protein L25
MSETTIIAHPRTSTGTRPSGRQRREGLVPAVVYGLGTDNQHVAVSAHELQHALSGEAGANTLISLQVEGAAAQLTLARQIQRHPVRGDLVHVDFVRIDVDTAVSAEVPVILVGEPAGVRIDGGVLDHILFTVTVEAKPTDIPNSIEVDVTDLEIGDQIRVESLPVPAGVSISLEPEELVAVVAAPAAEEVPEEGLEGLEGVEGVEGVEGEAPTGEAEGEAAASAEASESE